MTRYTSAYSALMQRLSEVETLLRLARTVAYAPPMPATLAHVNALCRSGVVLLSSHIEGFVEQVGEIALDRISRRSLPKSTLGLGFRYYLSQDLVKAIRATSDHAKIAAQLEQLLQRDGHIWDTNPNFTGALSVGPFIGDFSNPTHRRIRAFFGRFGYDQYERDIARRLRADFRPCANMVDQVIEQRNRIAHGDMVTTSTPTDLANMLDLVRLYCREADCSVADWFRTKGCPIR